MTLLIVLDLRINRMIKLIHLSLFITSSLIHFIIHINNIHLLKWHLVVRFIVRDAIIFCRMEFRFAIKFGRHCLSHTLKPDRSYNRFEFGWFGRTKASQIASTPQKYGYRRRYQNKIRFSIGANVIIKRNCVFNGWLSAKLVNGSYIFNVYQDFKTLKTQFYIFHRSNGP